MGVQTVSIVYKRSLPESGSIYIYLKKCFRRKKIRDKLNLIKYGYND